jgi:hypothetical protein
LKIASTKKKLVIGDGELKSSAKKNSNKNPLVFEIKITKNWIKIVSTIYKRDSNELLFIDQTLTVDGKIV